MALTKYRCQLHCSLPPLPLPRPLPSRRPHHARSSFVPPPPHGGSRVPSSIAGPPAWLPPPPPRIHHCRQGSSVVARLHCSRLVSPPGCPRTPGKHLPPRPPWRPEGSSRAYRAGSGPCRGSSAGESGSPGGASRQSLWATQLPGKFDIDNHKSVL